MNGPSDQLPSFSPRRLALRLVLGVSRIGRGMTLGVRTMLIKDDAVMLVRHTYTPGWHMPGGGVDAGETLYEAAVREAREEASIEVTGPASLFGIYRSGPRAHVALFVCREWEQPAPPRLPSLEIRECRQFSLDALPEGTTPGTHARLAEVHHGLLPATDW